MKDIKPLLLVLLSIGLVSTWVFHIYDKTMYSRQKTEVSVKDSELADGIKDSLNKLYSSAIRELDSRLDSSQTNADSLQNRLISSKTNAATLQRQLDSKLRDINRLKMEISNILGKSDFSKSDSKVARQKIEELQEKVDELSNQNLSMEEEKKQLGNALMQLTQNVDSLQMNIRRLSVENEALNEKVRLATVFIASEVKIEAIEVKGNSEENTSQAKKADKFVASFIVQNRVNQFSNVEVTTVLIQPDGHVMQSTVWDSGTFDAKKEGRKSFTRKIKFDYEKGEQKYLLFTVDTEKCQKGIYTFQVWHNGIMIGQASKKLS
jgi:peptidoglycan hydrolase CwlO-like protein